MNKLPSIFVLTISTLVLIIGHTNAAGVTEEDALVSLRGNQQNHMQQLGEKDLVPADTANNLTDLESEDNAGTDTDTDSPFLQNRHCFGGYSTQRECLNNNCFWCNNRHHGGPFFCSSFECPCENYSSQDACTSNNSCSWCRGSCVEGRCSHNEPPSNSNCSDDPNHRIPVPGAHGGSHSCSWLRHQNDRTKEIWCFRRGLDGSRTRNKCRLSCDNCPPPTPAPTPSPRPTCRDSSTFCVPFVSIGGGGGCHTCAWISRQNRSTRETWCNERDHNNRLTKDHCRATCNNCRSNNPTCTDSTSFRLWTNQGPPITCSTLRLSNRLRIQYCGRREGGKRVNEICCMACSLRGNSKKFEDDMESEMEEK